MKELLLKYGCNPNQSKARIYSKIGELPIEVLNGRPGYINFLDAFNSWQLVKELKEATGLPAAASFKHVSPAGAAVGLPMSDVLKKIYYVDDLALTPLVLLMPGLGVLTVCHLTETLLLYQISVIGRLRYAGSRSFRWRYCPRHTEEALEILKTKRKGTYNIIKIDPSYIPEIQETKDVFGITFEQDRNEAKITSELLVNRPTVNKEIPEDAVRDLLIALITLKYTQSNSVCYVKDGQAIGIGAGQQSRVHCTRLAGNKADNWWLRQNPSVLELPFKDSIRRPDRDNTIDVYISDDYEDILADGIWNSSLPKNQLR